MMQNWEIKSKSDTIFIRCHCRWFFFHLFFWSHTDAAAVYVFAFILSIIIHELTFVNMAGEHTTHTQKKDLMLIRFIFSQFDSIEINWFSYSCVYCCVVAATVSCTLFSVSMGVCVCVFWVQYVYILLNFIERELPRFSLSSRKACTALHYYLWKYSWQWPVVQNHHSIK